MMLPPPVATKILEWELGVEIPSSGRSLQVGEIRLFMQIRFIQAIDGRQIVTTTAWSQFPWIGDLWKISWSYVAGMGMWAIVEYMGGPKIGVPPNHPF